MKEQYTLQLSHHQAKILNGALHLAAEFVSMPPNQPVYNLPTGGIGATLVKDELVLIKEEVVRQLEEQDAQ